MSTNKTAIVRARVTPQLKYEVEQILNELGLSLSEVIVLTMAQICLHQGIPFEVKLPNKLTKETFEKTDAGQELNRVKNIEHLFEELDI